MRIGLIAQEYPPDTAKGGIGTQTYLKAHGLTALGHNVRVISRSAVKQRSVHEAEGIRVIRVPSTWMPVYTELADWLSYSQRVAEEIAAQHAHEAFDILDFPEWACEGYVHLLNRSEWNWIPTVLHLHGPLVMLARTLGWLRRGRRPEPTGYRWPTRRRIRIRALFGVMGWMPVASWEGGPRGPAGPCAVLRSGEMD